MVINYFADSYIGRKYKQFSCRVVGVMWLSIFNDLLVKSIDRVVSDDLFPTSFYRLLLVRSRGLFDIHDAEFIKGTKNRMSSSFSFETLAQLICGNNVFRYGKCGSKEN